jgi:hypothetical protein
MLRVAELRELSLEPLDFWASDKASRLKDSLADGQQLGFKLSVETH